MHLSELMRLLRQFWLMISLITLIGGMAGTVYTGIKNPTYTATSVVFISASSAESAVDLSQNTSFAQQVVKSYAEVATSPIVLNPVISRLRLNETAAELADTITAEAPVNTVVVMITVKNSSPSLAASIANAVSGELDKVVNRLGPSSSSRGLAVKVSEIQSAEPPTRPTSPNLGLDIVLGILGGLAAGVAAALLRRSLDTRVRSLDDMREASGVPIIGVIGAKWVERGAPSSRDVLRGRRGEAFRTMRAHLWPSDELNRPTVVLVTCSVQGEETSTVVQSFAAAINATGKSVAVIDANVHFPTAALLYGLADEIGLVDVLAGRISWREGMRRIVGTEIAVLPAGQLPAGQYSGIESPSMSALVTNLGEEFDVVIIDTPPLLVYADAAILASGASEAILVCASGMTRRAELEAATINLGASGVRILGLLATMMPANRHDFAPVQTYETIGDDNKGIASDGIREGLATN